MPTSLAFLGAALLSSLVSIPVASAEQKDTRTELADPPSGEALEGRRIKVWERPEAFVPHALVSPILYLERCVGGCTVNKGGVNDARTMTSTIPTGLSNIAEFTNSQRASGAEADEEWNAIVQCLKEVYSPFDVEVTDTKPAAGLSYHLAIVAGRPQEIGLGGGILGVAPGGCDPRDNVISFSFANAHGFTNPTAFVNNVCWTVAQESAHAYGLDHQYEYLDKRSACNDPMTYRTDCGGQKFFRNEMARCGEDTPRPCMCGQSQNSHLKILGVFGEGVSSIAAPTVAVTTPAAGGGLPPNVIAAASSKRGIAKVELFLNGYKWSQAPGALFGPNGQPASSYQLQVPQNLPNSVVDIVARAYDDLGIYTDSPVVTVTKGAPCTSADTCLNGQKCEAGKCFWEPPTGALGDDCSYSQFCESEVCEGTAEQKICTKSCIPGVADSCPENLTCFETGIGAGICFFPQDDGGCCSVGREGGVPWAHLGASALVVGLLVRRRRR